MKSEILSLIEKAETAKLKGYEDSMSLLEEAHLLSQPQAWPHFYVHWKMFALAYKFKNWTEFFGQVPRLLLAVPGSLTGRSPRGNIGSTKMGIFEERF